MNPIDILILAVIFLMLVSAFIIMWDNTKEMAKHKEDCIKSCAQINREAGGPRCAC